jgi:hypothetical protein
MKPITIFTWIVAVITILSIWFIVGSGTVFASIVLVLVGAVTVIQNGARFIPRAERIILTGQPTPSVYGTIQDHDASTLCWIMPENKRKYLDTHPEFATLWNRQNIRIYNDTEITADHAAVLSLFEHPRIQHTLKECHVPAPPADLNTAMLTNIIHIFNPSVDEFVRNFDRYVNSNIDGVIAGTTAADLYAMVLLITMKPNLYTAVQSPTREHYSSLLSGKLVLCAIQDESEPTEVDPYFKTEKFD